MMITIYIYIYIQASLKEKLQKKKEDFKITVETWKKEEPEFYKEFMEWYVKHTCYDFNTQHNLDLQNLVISNSIFELFVVRHGINN